MTNVKRKTLARIIKTFTAIFVRNIVTQYLFEEKTSFDIGKKIYFHHIMFRFAIKCPDDKCQSMLSYVFNPSRAAWCFFIEIRNANVNLNRL